jgi:hypothetical protein
MESKAKAAIISLSTAVPSRYVRYVGLTSDALSLTRGQHYQTLPAPAEVDGMLRVIYNTGED